MPTYKISQLTTATAVSATNQFEINQNGTSKSVEVSVIDAYIKSTSNLPVVVSVSSATDAVRITQTGTGNALVVEDSANPDSSPFVVDASGNVGIGTTTPTALLDVNGNVAITGTARRITGDFSNATLANRVMFQTSTANSNTGLGVITNGTGNSTGMRFFNGSDSANASALFIGSGPTDAYLQSIITGTGTYLPMAFYTGGSERACIDTSGNVGIGTSSPGSKLDVSGVIRSTGTSAILTVSKRSTGTGDAWGMYSQSGELNLYDYTAAVSRMVIDTSGNVGVGTSSPSQKLAVTGSIKASDGLFFGSDENYWYQSAANTAALRVGTSTNTSYLSIKGVSGLPIIDGIGGNLAFATSGTERMRVDSSGNVGIGTSSPASKLSVSSASSVQIQATTGTVDFRIQSIDANAAAYSGTVSNHAYAFTTNNSERVRIDSSGNVGIGTTSPTSVANYKTLTINGTTGGWLELTNGTVRGIVQNGTADFTVETRSNHPIIFGTNSIERARLDTSGNLLFNSGYGSVATAYGCRAWVNFNGTGTVAIRASGNVTSITDNGTGEYTLNFTTALPDANYSIVGSCGTGAAGNDDFTLTTNFNTAPTTTAARVGSQRANSGTATDAAYISVAIFR